MSEQSLLEFPCEFPIKIMGRTREGFAQEILALVVRHAPSFDPASMEMRGSSKGKYISLTCTIQACSRIQLEGLYRELSAHPEVLVVL